MTSHRLTLLAAAALALSGCVTVRPPSANPSVMAAVDFISPAGDQPARVILRVPRPVTALHFATELNGYRARDWTIAGGAFRWIAEGDGERLERRDGRPFTQVAFTVAQRYRSLIKSYGPFSPFSDGGLLVYSGHFHACTTLPCTAQKAVSMTIAAPGRTIRTGQSVGRETLRYVSHGEGTNVYIGTRAPQVENGMSAIIDPALPERLRAELARGLPASMAHFTGRYGPLSIQPELFVSIDSRGRGDGQESTQGGTLPRQIFMHFDGAQARQRAEQGEPGWLDWFFAHEVAHMFQRDRTGDRIGDDRAAWMHEGGADAMAALALLERGQGAYVARRVEAANAQCRAGLAKGPLTSATQRGDFEVHYGCGLIAALAVAHDLRARGAGLDDFNRRWFAALARAHPPGPDAWFGAAGESGVGEDRLRLLRLFTGPDAGAAQAALEMLAPLAAHAVSVLPAGN